MSSGSSDAAWGRDQGSWLPSVSWRGSGGFSRGGLVVTSSWMTGGSFFHSVPGQGNDLGDGVGMLGPIGAISEIDEEARAAGVAFYCLVG